MQTTLFDIAIAESSGTPPEPEQPKSSCPKRSAQPKQLVRVEQTLFGVVENDRAAAQRAKCIVTLVSDIENAPEFIDQRKGLIQSLAYYIRRSKQIRLDPNDRDGLLRLVGDIEEVLTDADRRSMHERKIWRPYPKGWLGVREGSRYAAALHEKEIRYLQELQDDCRQDIKAARAELKQNQTELVKLRAVAPLPPKIAERYGLTPDGFPLKKASGR